MWHAKEYPFVLFEGPKVFRRKNKYGLIVDNRAVRGVYASGNLPAWTRQQEHLAEFSGKGLLLIMIASSYD